jgi:hypothetical protein
MTRDYSKYMLILLGLWMISTSTLAQKLYYVGIPNSRMNYYASVQQKPQWCWAASIQMVMNYYQVDIDQQMVVERTYGTNPDGELPNWSANVETIHLNLNHKGIDKNGKKYIVNARAGKGAPEPALLIDELSQKKPVVIAYQADFGGHVVIITALSYFETPRGPIIRSIVVRDPIPGLNSPFANGRVEYDASTLASRMQAYWLVRVFTGD